MAEVTQGLLRGPALPLFQREGIAELNDELAVALPLAERHDQDAREVVVSVPLLPREIPHQMISHGIVLTEDIKVEGVDVVVQGLVIEKELGNEAQVLTVGLLVLSVHLKHRDAVISVDLVAWWISNHASICVSN